MTLQDYIKKDIERLEGMKVVPHDLKGWHHMDLAANQTLQTIIDIKRKELEELNEKV